MSPPVVFGPAARDLFALSAPTAVEAGAGSGKTTCLVELAVRLLSGEATGAALEPGAVVAITFTEKAAEELSGRLREAVAERTRAAAGTPEARAWLGRLAALDRLFAGTIHAFAGALLREHALEAGLDPAFAQLDEEAAAAWRLEAARGAVVAALDAGRVAAGELASVHGTGGARPGLAELLAELCRERATRGLSGPWVLPPDRTGEALEARARLGEAAGALLAARGEARSAGAGAVLEAVGATWAALGPADLAGPLSRPGRARLLALGEAARGRLARADGERLPAAREALLEAAAAFGPLAAEALGRAQAGELARLAAEAEARFAARKREARAQDFDDLLLGARDLLARDPALLAELRGRVRALLVDEVQDVNPLQQEIADLLTGPTSAGLPGPPALLVAVGDPKQSIYRFRGADVAVFRRLAARLGAGGEGRLLRLQENHRSSPAVLEVVNAVSAHALQPPSLPARPYELSFGAEDRLRAVRQGGQAPACELLDDPQQGNAEERRVREAAAVAARIAALVSGAAGLWLPGEGGPRRPGYGDVALLFRRLTQVGEYERALRRAGIPCRLVRGGGFYRASEVRDLGELLASLADPGDALAWAAMLRSPLCGLSDGALALLGREGLAALARREPGEAGRALAERLAETGAGAASGTAAGAETGADAATQGRRLARFLSTWDELRALRDRLASHDLLALASERLDLEAALLASPDGERRRDNLRKALALARRHDAGGGTPLELARRLRSLARQPPREPEADLPAGDAVAVLTVHQAKGLEWPVVFVPDLGAGPRADGRRALVDAEGRLCAGLADPGREEQAPGASLLAARAEAAREAAAESRRLLYVALTRARDYLVLSGSGGRESWRRMLDEALAARPGLAVRVPFAEAGRFAVGGAGQAAAPGAVPVGAADPAPPRLCPPPPRPALRAAVTDLAELARCPTRHHLARRLRLPERPSLRSVGDDDPERATARGTLAHAMLAEVDLLAPPLERRAQLTACAQRLGHDPAAPGPRRILADVTRFLESPPGRWLAGRARQGALRREVPFLLRLAGADGPACYLVGAIDALADEEGGGLHVLDFKYALPRRDAGERYRLQLAAYALAAGRAHPGRRVRASLQFLRGRCDAVEVTPGEEELARFAALAPRLAEALHGEGGEVAPAALGRTRERCEAEGCGYLYRCYRQPHPQAFP